MVMEADFCLLRTYWVPDTIKFVIRIADLILSVVTELVISMIFAHEGTEALKV